ncbi:MAG TPA: hypothetical protein VN325_23230 [Steroidobacteraceae bacterium]|nr:hypothetical protein [Steroidobacteraceae bacterium]
MTRRDASGRDDEGIDSAVIEQEKYLRLRCLELAVKMHDPDGAVSLGSAEETADHLLRYILTGTMAKQT